MNPPRHLATRQPRRRAPWFIGAILILLGILAWRIDLATTSSATSAPTSTTSDATTLPSTAATSTPTTSTQSTSTTPTTLAATTTTAASTTTTARVPTTTSPRTTGRTMIAIGDSVMVDYESDLEADLPGITVDAVVGQQWVAGLATLQQLQAEHRVPKVVVIGLGTNGPITPAQFDEMMDAAAGAERVVFITNHVDEPWQDSNNAILRAGVANHPNAAIADWAALAASHPDWFYADGTHLPIGGPGAQALAGLVASVVRA